MYHVEASNFFDIHLRIYIVTYGLSFCECSLVV